MAALSMRGREDVDGFLRAFAGTNRFILDFLLEEVLSREPEEVQTFLLHTSILTRLAGPLCEAVTGGSGGQEMLERLERRNLFAVPLDDDRRWYRYHHLFANSANSGAGNVVVSVPSGIAARVHATGGLGKVIVDSRFSKIDGNTYQSPDYGGAADRIEITAKTGAGNVSVSTK